MMPANHAHSCVCHITVLADAGMRASNRMLTAVDLTAAGVIVNKHFLNVTYRTFFTAADTCQTAINTALQ